jgi:hypothetical protein
MELELPKDIADACRELFDILPLDSAMPHLTGNHPIHTDLVSEIVKQPAIAARPALISGLWLYVDDLGRSHTVSQSIETPAGSFWHGIMHRREGDFGNSHYWMHRAAAHPLLSKLDSDRLVDEVAAARGVDVPSLVDRQRAEWAALFAWCAAHSGE